MLITFQESIDVGNDRRKAMLILLSNEVNKVNGYKIAYVGTKRDPMQGTILAFNDLVMLAEIRAFKIQQIDYEDRFSVFNSIDANVNKIKDPTGKNKVILDFYNNHIKGKRSVSEKLTSLVNSGFEGEILDRVLGLLDEKTRKYWQLGKDVIKANRFRTGDLDELLKNKTVQIRSSDFDLEIGKRYTKSFLKKHIQDVYDKLGITQVAKAIDLQEWYNIKPCKITLVDNNRVKSRDHGFEILGIK